MYPPLFLFFITLYLASSQASEENKNCLLKQGILFLLNNKNYGVTCLHQYLIIEVEVFQIFLNLQLFKDQLK